MLDKTVAGGKASSLYHGLSSELLLHNKEEFKCLGERILIHMRL